MLNYLDRLTALNRTEAFRMGLWHLMMARQQGHLAHRVLCSGYKVMFYLERVKVWGKWELSEVVMMECAVGEFLEAAILCAKALDQKGQVNQYHARIQQLAVELGTLGKTDEQLGKAERKRKEKAVASKPENLFNPRVTDGPTQELGPTQ